jgi:F-type H+-transporting ATPase subunit delta
MADNNTIARPYARACFEVAQQEDALAAVSASLAVGRELMRDGQVENFLANPALDDEQRLDFLTGLFRAVDGEDSVFGGRSEHGINVLKLLLEYRRVDVLPEIADHFDALKDEAENTVDVTVTSAAPLHPDQQQVIVASLQERLGRNVNLSTKIDTNLIGGAVIRAGDIVIDGSLRGRLEGLANALVS